MPTPIAVARIVSAVLEDVAAREAKVSFQDIKARSRDMDTPRDGKAALLSGGCTVVAELKRAAPYRGAISPLHTPELMAHFASDLESVGVKMLAVQTDRTRFHGSMADMRAVADATSSPIICRDLIVDPYQIHEARCYGADVVPLQVELLEQNRLEALLDRVESLGMTALAEVRDCLEVDRAIKAGASVVGVNAWSLASDEIYRGAFADIAPGLPESIIRIAVGGVDTPRGLLDYASRGADAVLVGESIMAARDPIGLARTLVAAGQHPACPSRQRSA